MLFSLVGTGQPRARPVRRDRGARPAGRSRQSARELLARWPRFTPALEARSPARAARQAGSRPGAGASRSRPAPCCATSSRRPRSPACAPIAAPASRSAAAAVFEQPAPGRSPRRDPALPARARSPRQRRPRSDDVSRRGVRSCHQPGAGRACTLGPGSRQRSGVVRQGRGPHAPARSEPDRRCALPPLSDRHQRRREPDRHHPERIAEQRHGPPALRRQPDAAAVAGSRGCRRSSAR